MKCETVFLVFQISAMVVWAINLIIFLLYRAKYYIIEVESSLVAPKYMCKFIQDCLDCDNPEGVDENDVLVCFLLFLLSALICPFILLPLIAYVILEYLKYLYKKNKVR